MTIILDTLSDDLAEALRKRAQEEHRSLNEVAIEAIARGLNAPRTMHAGMDDLAGIAGTMTEEDARAIDETVKWMDEGDVAAR